MFRSTSIIDRQKCEAIIEIYLFLWSQIIAKFKNLCIIRIVPLESVIVGKLVANDN
jgi:hypothetical protein